MPDPRHTPYNHVSVNRFSDSYNVWWIILTVLSFSSSVCGDHSASCRACFADAMAYLVNSAVVLSSPLSSHSEAVKPPSLSGPSLTAAPILTGSSLKPGRSFKDTIPHLLLIIFCHTVLTPVPRGVTRPRPVTTTRLIAAVYAMCFRFQKSVGEVGDVSVNSPSHVYQPWTNTSLLIQPL